MLDFSKFVEGHLIGVKVYQAEKRAALCLREATGKSWVLTATDVFEFMILQMCMQNIIDRISLWDSSSDEVDYRGKLFSLIHGKFVEEKDNLHSPLIDQKIEMIRRGDAVLVELEPVYGALVLILARKVSLVEDEQA